MEVLHHACYAYLRLYTGANNNDRNYVRSMLERFHFRRIGGSVFRYEGVLQDEGTRYEDWLNHIAPAIMFMRSFLIRRNMSLKFLTIDAASVSFLDQSDDAAPLGVSPQTGNQLNFAEPINQQSSVDTIRSFVDAAIQAIPAPAAAPPAVPAEA
ncbi:MAG TPA: hypothetical protein VMI06_08175 [Terriglobia bacterium]|nr:hypothetical protein [Terriglobia bacterium]